VEAQAASTAAKQPASFWKERMEPPRRPWTPPIVFLGHLFRARRAGAQEVAAKAGGRGRLCCVRGRRC